MKRLTALIFIVTLNSCGPHYFYQVYKTTIPKGVNQNSKIQFEDKNTLWSYDLWSAGGTVEFEVFNKSNSDIVLDLSKSFFVMNGRAYPYFQNRTFSKSSSNASGVNTYGFPIYQYQYSSSKVNITGASTSYIETAELRIPPNTYVKLKEYNITNDVFKHCDLRPYPSQSKANSLNYSEANSPYKFYNLLTYYSNTDTTQLQHDFYVSEITNYPSPEMYRWVSRDECGKKLSTQTPVFNKLTPDKFYIRYVK